MRLIQLKNIHAWVRSTSISEVLFVSTLILPIYLLLYDYMLQEINASWKNIGIPLALLLYIIGIVWMKKSQSSDEKNMRDLLIIRNYILDKGFSFMSFEKLLELDKDFHQDRIKELIFAFPNELRLAKLKDKKTGIKLLNIEIEAD